MAISALLSHLPTAATTPADPDIETWDAEVVRPRRNAVSEKIHETFVPAPTAL